MNNEFHEDILQEPGGESEEENSASQLPEQNIVARWTDILLRMGLGETLLRAGTTILSLVIILGATLLLHRFYHNIPVNVTAQELESIEPTPTPDLNAEPLNEEDNYLAPLSYGVQRQARIHTNIPSRPRTEVVTYTVQAGDTVFGIAEKYGLQPETILWGNYFTLLDDPHNLSENQALNILPTDGTYYQWQAGDGLNGVAKYFDVDANEIINYPGNNLNPDGMSDLTNPDIEPGTWLIIPGGRREFISWSAPLGITRDNPASARVLGPGACDPVSGGAVGYGYFVWPSNKHYLSGYDYSPKSNHWGIDIAGYEGEGIYAVDAGVVVYSGWNEYGYGNMIILDHGNGWQSLYAHLSEIYVGCGQSVGQGDAIGAFGSTGRSSGTHLHFELMTPSYKPNPWDYLPPP
ncbi:MAG: M23 family metallopeptidase [Anaerolineales bacterium]|nr:M23 family metallopeptidase [Anaerolineales bacterium]